MKSLKDQSETKNQNFASGWFTELINSIERLARAKFAWKYSPFFAMVIKRNLIRTYLELFLKFSPSPPLSPPQCRRWHYWGNNSSSPDGSVWVMTCYYLFHVVITSLSFEFNDSIETKSIEISLRIRNIHSQIAIWLTYRRIISWS